MPESAHSLPDALSGVLVGTAVSRWSSLNVRTNRTGVWHCVAPDQFGLLFRPCPTTLARIPQVLLLLVVLPIPESSKASPAPQLKHSGTGVSQAYYYRKKTIRGSSSVASPRTPSRRKHTHAVCIHGGNTKYRALCLESGNFSEFIHYVYNASNNELVRTSTLIKSTIIQVDATLFRQWYETHVLYPTYHQERQSIRPLRRHLYRRSHRAREAVQARPTQSVVQEATIDALLEAQLAVGRLYSYISSRPSQSGCADYYILEGKELGFYLRKLRTGKQKHAGLIHFKVYDASNELAATNFLVLLDPETALGALHTVADSLYYFS
ncbi:40S ribosomal protein S8 [Mycena sanguinolenta]|uniref:40S ribosomal protein S8 n=1 Tax=Mycena sanguinolenta TaxID=230812 RepID=A0A8H6YMU2_9AGAR|nr:40S ribosomal protein S8 [Mycena sanguinolenta]